MSSFIVENSTINRIATYLYHHNRYSPGWTQRKLAEQGIDSADSLGEAMYRLNLAAVDARYGDLESANLCDLNYTYRYELGQCIQVIKSLQCWTYQCSEGTCDETPLYRIMSDYMHSLAMRIVEHTKDYELAKWE